MSGGDPIKRIFISHKISDRELAEAIERELREQMDNVGFFRSEEFEKGTDWRKEIQAELKRSDFLLECMPPADRGTPGCTLCGEGFG